MHGSGRRTHEEADVRFGLSTLSISYVEAPRMVDYHVSEWGDPVHTFSW